jgi:hypothetical protein
MSQMTNAEPGTITSAPTHAPQDAAVDMLSDDDLEQVVGGLARPWDALANRVLDTYPIEPVSASGL